MSKAASEAETGSGPGEEAEAGEQQTQDEAGPEAQPLPDGGAAVPDGEVPGEDAETEIPAPPVAAVMVTRDPGPWLEESLAALCAQDYPNLVMVVIDAGSSADPAERIAGVAPGAFLRHLDVDRGFGASANVAIETVEGVSHFLFCHDDAAPDPTAVSLMMEEAFRSNAAIVAPKMVAWEDPSRILSVGMNADKLGALAERVVPGEIDQEQHDSVRDVFVAPGGFVLVRADLFTTLGGFDASIRMFGEDLDLCWRAQVAGARIVVAPQARVRHIEATRSGTATHSEINSQNDIRQLVRRHELRTLLKCYSAWSLVRVLPQAVLASAAEVVVCLIGGRFNRARAVVGAWRWNLGSRSAIRELRSARLAVQSQRHLPDREVREYQSPGFARVSSFVRRVGASYGGVHHLSAHGVEVASSAPAGDLFGAEELGSDTLAAAAPEDEIIAADAPGEDESAQAPFLILAGRWDVEAPNWALAAWALLLALLFAGMRHWARAGLPLVGQLGSLSGSVNLLHQYVGGRAGSGIASHSPAPSAFGVLGVVGTLLAGRMGFLQKLLFLGAFPIGALGAYRLVVPWGTRLARVLSMAAYLAVPLPYDFFGQGRLGCMVVYAAAPWLAARLWRAGGVEPFAVAARPGAGVWRTLVSPGFAAVAAIVALVAAVDPGIALTLGLLVAGAALGSLIVGEVSVAGRGAVLAVAGVAGAAVLLFPGIPSFAGRWQGIAPLVGQWGPAWMAPGLGSFVRFDVGHLGGGIAGWALLVPAGLGVVVGQGWRFRWAVRMWGVMTVSWLAAWAGAHGWLGIPADPGPSLVAGAVALACAVAMGACAFSADLPSHQFGWRQVASVTAAAGLLVSALPVVADVTGGRFVLPQVGWDAALGAVRNPSPTATTLWIGDPRAIPAGSWPLAPGLGYALTRRVLPDASDQWVPVDPGPAAAVASALRRARDGETSALGSDLARLGIGTVVVPEQLAPGHEEALPPPAWLVPVLEGEGGLQQQRIDPSLAFFSVEPAAAIVPNVEGGGTPPALYRVGSAALQLFLWVLVVRWTLGGPVSSALARRRRRAQVRARSAGSVHRQAPESVGASL